LKPDFNQEDDVIHRAVSLLAAMTILAACGAPSGTTTPGGANEEVTVTETQTRIARQPSMDFLTPELQHMVSRAVAGFGSIPGERRAKLAELAAHVTEQLAAGEDVKMTFICTHNSRRSHMSQIWAQTAAAVYGVPRVTTFSGGTEATAFNPRAVAAIKRAGFLVDEPEPADNPVYGVRFAQSAEPMRCFSKVFDREPNPDSGFVAVMTCSAADAACPLVPGAALRVAIPFEDPKAFDGTDQEAAKYDERCFQIATEMLFAFSLVEDPQA
jgi:protein-tyrosine-phosphatase